MKPDIKEDWIEALRSGEYDQTTGTLERKGANCCLGVIADVLGVPSVPCNNAGWERGPRRDFFGATKRQIEEYEKTHLNYGYGRSWKYFDEGSDAELTRRIKEEVRLDDEDMEALVCMNDGGYPEMINKHYRHFNKSNPVKWTFEEIANWIEAYL